MVKLFELRFEREGDRVYFVAAETEASAVAAATVTLNAFWKADPPRIPQIRSVKVHPVGVAIQVEEDSW